mgnify:CR=1 FL=1
MSDAIASGIIGAAIIGVVLSLGSEIYYLWRTTRLQTSPERKARIVVMFQEQQAESGLLTTINATKTYTATWRGAITDQWFDRVRRDLRDQEQAADLPIVLSVTEIDE